MTRKTALLGAGILTGIMAVAYLMVTTSAAARASSLAMPVATGQPSAVALPEVNATTTDEFAAALAAREAVLQSQLAGRQAALTALDETYSVQFAALEERLATTNDGLEAAAQRLEDVQSQISGVQEEINTTDLTFQQEMNGIQNNLVYEDARVRQEIEVIYAQLQQAYGEIAAREAQVTQTNNAHDGGSEVAQQPPAGQTDGDHDDDHDDDHEGNHDGHDGDEQGDDHGGEGDHDD